MDENKTEYVHVHLSTSIYCIYNFLIYTIYTMTPITSTLTKKQKDFFEVLQSYIQKHAVAPTIAQLQKACQLSSPRAVSQYLTSLEKKGFISRSRYEARGITLRTGSDSVTTISIPVIASAGCDNLSVVAQRTFGEYICVASDMLGGRPTEYVVSVRASGDSMVDAGITDGDYVLVELTQAVREGDLVVAIIDGNAVIKKLEVATNAFILRPVSSDPTYRPIIVSRNFKIFGKVIDIIRRGQQGDIEIVPLYQ